MLRPRAPLRGISESATGRVSPTTAQIRPYVPRIRCCGEIRILVSRLAGIGQAHP
jgi:hypothetical protein